MLRQNLLQTFTVLACVSAPALANDAMPLPPDATKMETEAYAVLEKHCSRCHQDGALADGLTSAKSGFGHVLDIRRLAEDPKFIVPGDPSKSKMLSVIGEYAFPRMPDDCGEKMDCYPTANEVLALDIWVTALGEETKQKERVFVSIKDEYAYAFADLQAQPTNRRDKIRYISLRVPYNDPEVSDNNLAGYKAATIKMLNLLSTNPVPYKAQWVDEYETLLRVYLPDLGWDAKTWELLESYYPYGAVSATGPSLTPLQTMSYTKIPVMRADWMASEATVPPLYYDILKLPDTFQGLISHLKLDYLGNIHNELVVRAGFQDSGVSTHNRLIERHPLGTGFFWTSYDFAGSSGKQSFFRNPLGPTGVYKAEYGYDYGDDHAFIHDGGETIFTLPNGFHAYYLNTADGKRLNTGPTEIVRDDDYTDGTGEVVNGISCISCHIRGIRLNEDEVRDVALADLSLPANVRQVVDAIYPGQAVVGDWLQKDTVQFETALRSAGIDPDIKAGGLEPVRGLFVYYVDLFIDFNQAANELGLTEDELRGRIPFVGHELAGLMLRLDRSPIQRDEWEAAYHAVLEKVTDYKPYIAGNYYDVADASHSVKIVVDTYKEEHKEEVVKYEPPTPVVHDTKAPDYTNKHVVKTDDYVPPLTPTKDDPNYKPTAVVKPDDYVPPAVDYVADDHHKVDTAAPYDPHKHSLTALGHLTIYTDKANYKVGEGVRIFIEPRYDCRLTLISYDEKGRSCVIYPHPALEDIVIKGGTQYTFPPQGALTTTEPGKETILAICNGSPEAVGEYSRDPKGVSCDAGVREKPYEEIKHEEVYEVLAFDPKAVNTTKVAVNGADYKALSTQNPYVAKAEVSIHVDNY